MDNPNNWIFNNQPSRYECYKMLFKKLDCLKDRNINELDQSQV